MRGLAALCVLGGHCLGAFVYRFTGIDTRLAFISEFVSSHAVLVFFLLSGYLITGSIIRNINKNNHFDFVSYVIDRVTRIYPPLTGAIIVCILCWVPIHFFHLPGSDHAYGLSTDLYTVRSYYSFNLIDVLRAFVFLNGLRMVDGPLWSLCIEVFDYALAMLLFMAFFYNRKGKLWVVILLFVLLVSGYFLNPQFYFFTFIWFMGSSIAVLHSLYPHLRQCNGWMMDVLMALALLLMLIFASEYAFHKNTSPLMSYGSRILFCMIYSYFMFVSRFFQCMRYHPLILAPADYSYSLYVIHFPLMLLVSSLTQGWIGQSLTRASIVTVCAAISITAVAWIFAKFFENQSLFKPYVRSLINYLIPQYFK